MSQNGKAGRGVAYLDGTRKDRNAGFTKHGSKSSGKEGSHLLSHEVAAAALKHSQGRGGGGKSNGTDCYSISKAINENGNVRMKLKDTNRELDRRRDERIVSAIETQKSLKEATTAKRAVQAYKGSIVARDSLKGGSKSKTTALDSVTDTLGSLTFNDGRRGRPVKVATLARW